MFKIGEYVVYNKEVCKIIEIRKNIENNADYYILIPISNESLKIEIPTLNFHGHLRSLITKTEANQLLENIQNVDIIISDNRSIEKDYKLLINSGKLEDLMKIMKTNYFKNKEKSDNKKITVIKNSNYYSLAEKYICEEFSVVLGKSYEDVKNYIVSILNETNK